LSKFKIISVKQEKEIGLILFCPRNYETFKEACKEFSNSIKLNDIYYNSFQSTQSQPNKKIIIASASFKDYITPLFPNKEIIASTLRCNNKNLIKGIAKHPYGSEKASLLEQFGYNKIKAFYTDSKTDLSTSALSETTYWVHKGQITHQT